MKHVLIVANDLEIGGAEKALLGLLETIETSKVSVDLFLLKHSGQWLSYVPKKINLLPEIKQYASLAVPVQVALKNKCIGVLFGRALGKSMARRYIKQNGISGMNSVGIQYSFKYTKCFLPMISEKEYDLVIGFSTPYYIPVEKVKSKRKVAWLHTDYSVIDGDRKEEAANWNTYDELVAVSDDVKNQFIKVFPTLADKTIVMENILPISLIKRQAEEHIDLPYSSEEINLLSVGRFSYAKNFDNIPEICKRVKEEVKNVRWYIIGYGPDEALIRQKIQEYGVQDTVIILGKKENPYPYIQACDLYIQPSRYEGKAVTVREAQMLGKPVVITAYATSRSQLTDGVDGVIVPMDNEGCAEEIIRVIRDKELRESLVNNCLLSDFSNSSEIEKIYELIQ